MNQRPMTTEELGQFRVQAFYICLALDKIEAEASEERKAAALLIARFGIFRAKVWK